MVSDWPLWEGDVRNFNWSTLPEGVDLLAGGPPCQPFSMGGKHRAHGDDRDMFPATVEVLRTLRPKSFIVENVKGLTRSSFANYYQYILLQLEFPEVARRGNESWIDHLKRLQTEKTSGALHVAGLTYNVVPTLVNAADYGVPQKRERVFIVGFRSDLGAEWSFPRKTHDLDALLHSQWVTGDYWERHCIAKRHRPGIPERHKARIGKFASSNICFAEKPWRTVRDALKDVPDPQRDAGYFLNHAGQLGNAVPVSLGRPASWPHMGTKM